MAKSFQFSLKRVQQFKEQVLKGEKATLAALNRERQEIEDRISAVRRFLRKREEEVREAGRMTPAMLQSYRYYVETCRNQLEALEAELQLAIRRVEAQQQVVILASQELQGYDKLEEKQLDEYRRAVAKETQEEILEMVSNKLGAGTPAR